MLIDAKAAAALSKESNEKRIEQEIEMVSNLIVKAAAEGKRSATTFNTLSKEIQDILVDKGFAIYVNDFGQRGTTTKIGW